MVLLSGIFFWVFRQMDGIPKSGVSCFVVGGRGLIAKAAASQSAPTSDVGQNCITPKLPHSFIRKKWANL